MNLRWLPLLALGWFTPAAAQQGPVIEPSPPTATAPTAEPGTLEVRPGADVDTDAVDAAAVDADAVDAGPADPDVVDSVKAETDAVDAEAVEPVTPLIDPDLVFEIQGPSPPTVEELQAELAQTRQAAEAAAAREAAVLEALEAAAAVEVGPANTPADTATTPSDHSDVEDLHRDTATPADHPAEEVDAPSIVGVVEPGPDPRFLPFLPTLPFRGLQPAILLLALAALSWLVARALGAIRERLAPSGLLPTLLGVGQQGLRVIALFFALGVVAAIVPDNLAPALPWVVAAGAIAIGWSARDLMPDLIAGVVLAAERRILPGRWVSTPDAAGVVEQIGFRVTWLIDVNGRRVAVPNRVFLSGAVITDRGTWPSVEVVIRVPPGLTPSRVHRALEDALLVSPWAAPVPPEMVREEQEPGMWRVRARVLEGRFADRFEGALREHVEETLDRGTVH